jgi:hypothetical protein
MFPYNSAEFKNTAKVTVRKNNIKRICDYVHDTLTGKVF